MTTDMRTPQEIAYDRLALSTREQIDADQRRTLAREADQILATAFEQPERAAPFYDRENLNPNALFGHLPNGTAVIGELERTGARVPVVYASGDEWSIFAGEDGGIALGFDGIVDDCSTTVAELRSLRDWLNTGTFEQVAAAAEAWAAGVADLPKAPIDIMIDILEVVEQPEITTSQLWYQNGNLNDKGIGLLAWNEYALGDLDDQAHVLVALPVAAHEVPEVMLFGREAIPLDVAERAIANLQQILADPCVVAARAAWEARHAE